MVYDRVRKDKWAQYAGVGAFGKRKTQPQWLGFHISVGLQGRLRQAPVVGLQAGEIVPGLGCCML